MTCPNPVAFSTSSSNPSLLCMSEADWATQQTLLTTSAVCLGILGGSHIASAFVSPPETMSWKERSFIFAKGALFTTWSCACLAQLQLIDKLTSR